MGEVNDRYERILRQKKDSSRVQYFSDAVFAIAMTLLVIDVTLPNLTNPSNQQLFQALVDLSPKFLAYAISFVVIAINWSGHHRKFSVTRDYDRRVVQINLCLLFLIAFVPFPTSLISEYPSEIAAVVCYALVVAAIGLVQFWMWSYTYRMGYLDEEIDLGIYRMIRRELLIVPVVFVLSIPIAFIPGTALWAMYFWILIWPVSLISARLDKKAPVGA